LQPEFVFKSVSVPELVWGGLRYAVAATEEEAAEAAAEAAEAAAEAAEAAAEAAEAETCAPLDAFRPTTPTFVTPGAPLVPLKLLPVSCQSYKCCCVR
jgi:hypothetical protein